MHFTQTGAIRSSLITIAAIVILLAFAFSQLPKGFSNDLSRIGQGANVAVLLHNKESVQSLDFMDLVSKVRADYDKNIEFLVVDVNSQEGRSFMQQQQIKQPGLALFAPDGKRLGILNAINNEKALRAALKNYFMLH